MKRGQLLAVIAGLAALAQAKHRNVFMNQEFTACVGGAGRVEIGGTGAEPDPSRAEIFVFAEHSLSAPSLIRASMQDRHAPAG